jgi:hypothetical protein
MLAAQPLGKDTELKAQLKARGAAFTKLKGTHYLEYHDYMIQRRTFGLESRILKFRVLLTPCNSLVLTYICRLLVALWSIVPHSKR